ncbi:MAG: LPS assembly lipoprotein LptE [Bacteroidales bacterium]|nr:LPS assembly lipoprotein LptE [Bacteroidales bacterium]
MTRSRRFRTIFAAVALTALAAAGCVGSGGDFSLFGYSTVPPYDPNIRSVHIPVFKTIAFYGDPYRGIEADVTRAVVNELSTRRTPIRVVGDADRADTELIGTIVSIDKWVLNRNQLNYARELELVITAEIVWRDLRSGKVLTNPRRGAQPVPEQFDPSLPPPPPLPPDQTVVPVRLTSVGRFIPELGESNATGQKAAIDMLARQIVDMMESPW